MKRKTYMRVQFHPEVRHSEYGNDLLKTSYLTYVVVRRRWSMENFIEVEIREDS